MDTKICSGEGEVTARILRGLWQILTLVTGSAGFSPGQFQILCGFCPDWPGLCQGRAPWLTQTLQEATGKETSSTSSPPQPPTQLHLALGPGQDLPAPVQGKPEHSSGRSSQKHCRGSPISRPLQPGSPIPAPSPVGSIHAATGTKPLPATAGRAAVPTRDGSGVGSLLFIPVVPAWKC